MSASLEFTINHAIESLMDEEKRLSKKILYRLSDLSVDEVQKIKLTWNMIPVKRRQLLLESISRIYNKNSLLSFDAVSRLGLQDNEAYIRRLAVQSLRDAEDKDLAASFLIMLEKDPSPEVRSVVATALGKFVYMGEVDELSPELASKIVSHLIRICRGDDPTEIRRHALESLGYSSHKNIPALIEKAYFSGNDDWLASSLSAMGKSANNRWNSFVQDSVNHDNISVRLEAIRAAGELEIKQTLDSLFELTQNEDDEIRHAAIWSLSQIGGEGVQELLEKFYDNTEDEDDLEFIEAAFDNLAFTQDMELFSLIELNDQEDEKEFPLDENLLEDFEEEDE
jgi:HEAT repeat protein